MRPVIGLSCPCQAAALIIRSSSRLVNSLRQAGGTLPASECIHLSLVDGSLVLVNNSKMLRKHPCQNTVGVRYDIFVIAFASALSSRHCCESTKCDVFSAFLVVTSFLYVIHAGTRVDWKERRRSRNYTLVSCNRYFQPDADCFLRELRKCPYQQLFEKIHHVIACFQSQHRRQQNCSCLDADWVV